MKVALIAPQMWVHESYRRPSEHLFRKSGANTGNFAFVQALWSHLSPHVEIFPWEASPEVMRERCDIVVMACANQLGPHSNLEQLAIMLRAREAADSRHRSGSAGARSSERRSN